MNQLSYMTQKVNKGEFNVDLFVPEIKSKEAEGLRLFTRRRLGSSPLSFSGCLWMCTVLRVCLWSCVRKHFPTNAAHNAYAFCITTPIRPSLSPSLPNSNSFISLSAFNKAPIHCPANQSLHSCGQLSMTRFIWLGPRPSNRPSFFSIVLIQITVQCPKSWGLHDSPAYGYKFHTSVSLHLWTSISHC